MLGHKLVQQFQEKFDVWTTFRGKSERYEKFGIFEKNKVFENINVEEIDSIENVVKTVKPDVIINAVGIIKQLPSSKNTVKTLQVNSIFPHQLADIAGEHNSRLITISTDCVYNGKKGNYSEGDVPNATDLYGKSKNLGEVDKENCLTLRTSIIGRELETSHSLVEWFLSNEGKKVNGFVNAIYTGFPTIVLADILEDLIINHRQLEGIYHVSSEPINKYDLLKLLKKAYNLSIEIEPYEDFQIDSSLNSDKFRKETGFSPMNWEKMIEKMAADQTVYTKNN